MRKMAKSLVLLLVLVLALTGCKESKVPEKVLIEDNVYAFSDGEQVSVWSFLQISSVRFEIDSKLIYQLSDGTELLATRTAGLEQSEPENAEILRELSQTAQDNILAFYRTEGVLYDLEAYLEQAYEEYQENPKEFRCYLLTQECEITATDEATVTCTTTVELPDGQGEYKTESVEHTFDRETGTLMEN